ncbi:MAG TPA: class 1 fructose-bisphosphatase [Bacteroidales bacterium]|jgi:fructose-1,6-bisphosphatase I|nr:class 1 fructose-bisphosphatase [Bacteroidota bacterium]HOP58681.1 class 1 fructose-bisphosphatase [Bacteroidales bacterium]HPI69191.1 class 1 fructose-bisphosphatase [Bacteroidales bacterium]
MNSYRITTLNDFIIQKQKDFSYASGDLSSLLSHIGTAAKIVNKKMNKAGLVDILGKSGSVNIQGETQQKLDVFADKAFTEALRACGECCGIATEENQNEIVFTGRLEKKGKYIVCMDPLDGSSNIDYNVSVGSIFSIYRRISPRGKTAKIEDFMQPGINQVAAGYVIYGSSTMMVYSTGNGVNGFTLDPSIGEFCLSHPNIKTPVNGNIYSINEGNYTYFPLGIKKFLKFCQEKDEDNERPYTSRYIGSLVSDFHRNLLIGGIFLYPQNERAPQGKLRVVYECNPMAFLAEQAGGAASDGFNRIMEMELKALHQRSPFYVGSLNMVQKVKEFLKAYPD